MVIALGYAMGLSAFYLWWSFTKATYGSVSPSGAQLVYGLIMGLVGAVLAFVGAVLIITDRRSRVS